MPSAPAPGSEPSSVDILGMGMVTPVGLDAQAAAAAIRGGIAGTRETTVCNKLFDPHVMALVDEEYLEPLLPDLIAKNRTSLHERLLQLAAPALAEAAASLSGSPAPLFLGLPEAGAQLDPIAQDFIADLAMQAEVSLLEPKSAMQREGGASGLLALRQALAYLEKCPQGTAVVGAVDSFLDFPRLARLDHENRIKCPGSLDGFIPGEAAAFITLGKGMGGTSLARVLAVGTGEEKGHRYSTEPYRGDGLAQAFQDCFQQAGANLAPVRTVYAGFNGESLAAKEWGVALLRTQARFAEDFAFAHPAECIGDAGAALGLVSLICAVCGFHKQYRHSPALVWSASDKEHRAAALVASSV